MLGIVAGIALVVILLGAFSLVVIFGGERDDASARFEPVGRSIPSGGTGQPGSGPADPFEPQQVMGDGDPSTFADVMPGPDEVTDAMGETDDLEHLEVEANGPGPTGVICAEGVSANALASHREVWEGEGEVSRWELQVSVFDFGSPAEATRVITARHSEEFLDCTSENPADPMAYRFQPEELHGEIIDHREGTDYGRSSTAVLMRADTMVDCPDGTGRVALVWQQVGQYSLSAKAFGCDFDLETARPILDEMAERLE